jgi:diguanylate cyclase (GGDEF)-like protein
LTRRIPLALGASLAVWYLFYLATLEGAASAAALAPPSGGICRLGVALLLIAVASFGTALAGLGEGPSVIALILTAGFLQQLFGHLLFPFAIHYLTGAVIALLLPLPSSAVYTLLLAVQEFGPLAATGRGTMLPGLLLLALLMVLLSVGAGLYTARERRFTEHLLRRNRRFAAEVRELDEIDPHPRGADVADLAEESRLERTAGTLRGLERELNDLVEVCRIATSAAFVVLYRLEGEAFCQKAFAGEVDPSGLPEELCADEGPVGWVLRQGEPLSLTDEKGVGDRLGILPGGALRSAFLEPILRDDSVVGLLVVGRFDAAPADPRTQEIARRIGHQVERTVAMTSTILHQDDNLKKWVAVTRAAKAMSQSLREEEILAAFLGRARELTPCDGNLLVAERDGEVRVFASEGLLGQLPPGSVIPLAVDSYLSRLWRYHHIPPVEDLRHLEDRLPLVSGTGPSPRIASLHGLALTAEGETLAALLRVDRRPGHFTDPVEQDLLRLLADHASLAVANGMLHRTIRQLAVTDPLTSLPNRRLFTDRLEEEFGRLSRRPGHLSMVMIDIDRFKSINDTWGHPFGDIVLKGVAATVAAVARRTDLAARLGGEEFALLLIDTDEDGAVIMAGRLAEGIHALSFPSESGPVRVTVSQGISVHPGDADTPEALVARADEALYRAKESGRDRYCLARDQRP